MQTEAFALECLGASENDYKIAITHCKNGPCHLQFSWVLKVRPNEWKNKIAVATLGINEEGEMSAVSRMLESHRFSYEISLNDKGMNTEETIIAGLKYATGLWIAHHCIEAEWLLTQLPSVAGYMVQITRIQQETVCYCLYA